MGKLVWLVKKHDDAQQSHRPLLASTFKNNYPILESGRI
jgi:hypothetical protein